MRGIKIFCMLFFPFTLLAQPSDAELEQRIGQIRSIIPLEYNSFVKSHILDYLRNDRGNSAEILEQFELYQSRIEDILISYGLPGELKYLALSLSGCSNFETSEEGGTGFYLMRYNVAKSHGLHISSFVDERRDLVKATRVLAVELKKLYKQYGDWYKTIAAWYASSLELERAMRYAADSSDNYWKVHSYLPFSYQKTVPKYIAAVYFVHYHKKHGISASKRYQFKVDTVPIGQYSTLIQLAAKLEVDYETLKTLNPLYKKQIIPNSGRDYYLVLPADKVAIFYDLGEELFTNPENTIDSIVLQEEKPEKEEEEVVPEVPTFSNLYYTVRRGDILLHIADYYDCYVGDIKKWNNLRSDRIQENQRLKIIVATSKLPQYKKINGMSTAEKRKIAAKD